MDDEITNPGEHSLEELKAISKKNPDQVIELDNGKFLFNGQIFSGKEELFSFIRIFLFLVNLRKRLTRFFRFKGKDPE